MRVTRGATSLILPIFLTDSNGLPKTGVLFNTTGLSICYRRELDAAVTSITLVTMTAGTWTTSGFIQSDATNEAGQYQLGLPDAAISNADGSRWVTISVTGTAAANLYARPLRIDLEAVDMQNATSAGISRIDAEISSRLAPTTAGRTLDVATTGEAGLDFDNIKQATGATTLSNIRVPNVTLVDTTTNLTNNTPTIGTVTLAASQPNYAPLKQSDILSDSGTAQSGSTTNIRLKAGAPAVTLVGQTVFITTGTGAGQSSPITAYDTTTKDATTTWGTAPDNTSVYVVLAPQGGSSGGGGPTLQQIVDGVWDELNADHTVTGSQSAFLAAILAKANLLSSSTTVNVISPVSSSQNINVIRGDDYKNSDGRALEFTVTNCPSLVGATVALIVGIPGGSPRTFTATVTSATEFYVELTSAETLAFNPGPYIFDIQATLAVSGDIVTPVQGNFTVIGDVR